MFLSDVCVGGDTSSKPNLGVFFLLKMQLWTYLCLYCLIFALRLKNQACGSFLSLWSEMFSSKFLVDTQTRKHIWHHCHDSWTPFVIMYCQSRSLCLHSCFLLLEKLWLTPRHDHPSITINGVRCCGPVVVLRAPSLIKWTIKYLSGCCALISGQLMLSGSWCFRLPRCIQI